MLASADRCKDEFEHTLLTDLQIRFRSLIAQRLQHDECYFQLSDAVTKGFTAQLSPSLLQLPARFAAKVHRLLVSLTSILPQVLVSHKQSNIEIRRVEMDSLRGLNWLNDEIMNIYVNLLQVSLKSRGCPQCNHQHAITARS